MRVHKRHSAAAGDDAAAQDPPRKRRSIDLPAAPRPARQEAAEEAAPGAPTHTPSSGCPFASLHSQGQQQPAGASCPFAAAAAAAPTTPSPRAAPAPWDLRRPQLAHCPKLTRRQLRAAGRAYTLSELAQHRYVDDCWIAVDGSVYDITEHVAHHPSWQHGGISTILSILAHAGSECSAEFHEIHRPYPVAHRQLRAFYIGDLAAD
jgi:predicted heme/steroid binding protein